VRFDDVYDLLCDRCGIVASNRRVSLGPELTVQDSEERLCILIAPDAFRNIPTPILAGHLAREVHDAVQVLALGQPLLTVGADGLFEQLGELFVGSGPIDLLEAARPA